MGFFSCFSSSTKQDDPSEDHYKTAIKISKHVKEDSMVRQKREKAEQIEIERAKEISLKLFEEEEEKRRLKESKEEGNRDDDQVQVGAEKTETERANEISLKLFEEKRRLQESKEEGKREKVDDEQIEINRATEESLKLFEKEEEKRRSEKSKEEGKRKQVEEEKGQIKHSNDQEVNPPSQCKGSKSEMKDGLSGNAVDGLLHPHCVCCLHCHKPFAVDEIRKKGTFHRSCYREHRNTCYVCQREIPLTEEGRKYNKHPFWKDKYCPCHDVDGTAKCCSCERLEPKGTNFVMLGDDRWLCLQCIGSSVMDSDEGIDLHVEIREFFDGLFFKVEKEFPLLLVEKQALSKAEKEEKIDYHAVVTRGICLSEEQYVTCIKERPTLGPNNTLINMVTEIKMVSGCEVTAILILYGLPRLLTGYILAHEMMHAWLRLNGYKNLKLELEEGLCQVLGLRWLESHTFASTDAAAASSSSNTPPAASTSKKADDWSDFEKKLVEFCIHQIKEDDTPLYGQGFKQVYEILVSNHYSLKDTLRDIVKASKNTLPAGSKF